MMSPGYTILKRRGAPVWAPCQPQVGVLRTGRPHRAAPTTVFDDGLEPDLHEHLQAVLFEIPLFQAVPAAEAPLEAGGADGHAEVVGDPGVRVLRHEAAAEVGGEGAPVVLVVGAEFRRPEGVVGVE